ncbi:hypothetical protein LLE49_10815 [Alicyclobacillus tolerans]|uniref:hypothetical protein n=1 Tax=Alicyclobacillus tolerans TaxID=90970 RepID=UPI001F1E9748|nr:hypothetical protein [Alicyclobacillus tolerans]MCF8565205.1 hypothetical protein [Alicyclobacillus tolerans]
MPMDKQARLTRNRPLSPFLVGTALALAVVCNAWFHAPVACADTPGITDFGQGALAASVGSTKPSQALFVTLYPDGREQIEVRTIQDDAMVSYASEHSPWRLDGGLMWFVQMPVYVRELTSTGENEYAV